VFSHHESWSPFFSHHLNPWAKHCSKKYCIFFQQYQIATRSLGDLIIHKMPRYFSTVEKLISIVIMPFYCHQSVMVDLTFIIHSAPDSCSGTKDIRTPLESTLGLWVYPLLKMNFLYINMSRKSSLLVEFFFSSP
jgi:hypothetical protein